MLAAVFFHQPLIRGIGSFFEPAAYRDSGPPVARSFEPESVAASGESASVDSSPEHGIEAAPTQPMDIEPEISPESEPNNSTWALSDGSAAEGIWVFGGYGLAPMSIIDSYNFV